MSGKIRIVARAALAAAMGLSVAAAQKASTVSSSKQAEPAEYVFEVCLTLDGAGIPNRNVSVTASDTENELRNDTDSSGCAHFHGLKAGQYSVDMGAWHAGVVHVPASRRLTIRNTTCSDCVFPPMAAAPEIETTTSSLDDRIPQPADPSPSIAPTSATPHRNALARFVFRIEHKLGL
jgi:hypothetical protein